jgi:hypothetical protein
LLTYLRKKLSLSEDDIALKVVRGKSKEVSKFCLAFNLPELYLKKMETLEYACEKKNSKEPYLISRVSAMSQLQI